MSLGAKTLLHAATLAPERFEAMVVVSATPRFPPATRAVIRAMAAGPHSAEEQESMRRAHVGGDAQIAALWGYAAMFADDPDAMPFTAETLGAIRARTLIVAGDRDPLYPVELAVDLYRGIPAASLWVVPGGGHGPIFGEHRAAFAAGALSFLHAAKA